MTSIANRTVKPGGFVGSTRKASDIRGFCVHMAEGTNVAAYLSRNPRRNVSVQYTVETDGGIIAMVPERKAAGSINPRTLRTSNDADGYYGAKHAKAALRGLWSNPNKGVIAVEVAGKAVKGPNDKQVESLVRLFRDCRTRYPKLVPLGHRDFQDVKRCPGKTAAIKRAFSRMGGHGLDYDPIVPKPEPPPKPPVPTDPDDLAELEAENADLRSTIAAMLALGQEALGDAEDAQP
jgi:hypothetical protein